MNNPFSQILDDLENLSANFRESVCRECDWSSPTFYRKIRIPKSINNLEMKFLLNEAERQLNLVLDRNFSFPGVEPIVLELEPKPSICSFAELYKILIDQPVIFRKKLRKECGWDTQKICRIRKNDALFVSSVTKMGIASIFNIGIAEAFAKIKSMREQLKYHTVSY